MGRMGDRCIVVWPSFEPALRGLLVVQQMVVPSVLVSSLGPAGNRVRFAVNRV